MTSTPRVLIVRLLEACDAGCFMCSFANSTDGYRFSVTDATTLAAELRGSSIRLVRFTGGEPLLVPELELILDAFWDVGLLTSLITNGSQLHRRAEELRRGHLGQVIVSIDGASARKHDRLRRTLGLFDQAIAGVREVRRRAPEIRLRVNTVVSPSNVADLQAIYDLLAAEGVDQWSIIPLKWNGRPVKYNTAERLRAIYHAFQTHVDTTPGPTILGEGRNWAGRNEVELEDFIEHGRPFTPRPRCQLVRQVRYFTPKDKRIYPCNCVPHRLGAEDLGWPMKHGVLDDGVDGEGVVSWLGTHGPDLCSGCEPVNVSLGEGTTDLDDDIFAY